MNHPILTAALVEDQRRGCPCGAVVPQSYAYAARAKQSHPSAARPQRGKAPRRCQPTSGNPRAGLLKRVVTLLQIISKEVES
jgi:hypothetical protein